MTLKSSIMTFAAVIFVLMSASGQAAELNWTEPQFVVGSSLALGNSLDLHAVFNGDFRLAVSYDGAGSIWCGKWEEPTWTVMEEAVDVTGTAGFFLSMDMFGSFPVIMHTDLQTGYMYWTMNTGSSWMAPDPVLGAFSTDYVQMCMDNLGATHAVWTRLTGTGYEIFYGTDRTGDWVHEHVASLPDPGILVEEIDIAVDSSRRPHFIWWDPEDAVMKYSVRTSMMTFETEEVTGAVECNWTELVIMDGDIPYLGFMDHLSSGGYAIKERFKVGSSWYGGTVVTEPVMYDADLAIAVEEGILVSNLYFVYSTNNDLRYAHYQLGWKTKIIEGVSLGSVADEISADWDSTRNAVGVAIRDWTENDVYFLLGYLPSNPTPTPDPSGSPTPTPTPRPIRDLILDLGPDLEYGAGDSMMGSLRIENPGAARSADVYVLLEVFGEYWFAPGWTHDLDDFNVAMDEAGLNWLVFLPEFTLPDPLPAGGPFYFYAAAFSPGTLAGDTIISNVDNMSFYFR